MTTLHLDRVGDGEPMLLVHGIGGELCVWEPVVGPLAERFDVISVDLPGFGRSPALPEDVVPAPAALAAALAGLLDELGIERAHVAGNSLGGWVALELAVLGRARSVTGLCPAGLWGRPLLPEGAAARGRAHRLVRRVRPLLPIALASRRLRRAALAPFVADPDKVPYHAAWRMVRSYGRATAYEATSTAMRRTHFHAGARVAVPVALGFGDHDRLIRPARTDVPGAETVILRGCGHIPMWDDPEQVVALVERTAGRAQRLPVAPAG